MRTDDWKEAGFGSPEDFEKARRAYQLAVYGAVVMVIFLLYLLIC